MDLESSESDDDQNPILHKQVLMKHCGWNLPFFPQKYKYIKALGRIVLVYLEGMLPSGICPIAKLWGVLRKQKCPLFKMLDGGPFIFSKCPASLFIYFLSHDSL